MHSWEPGLLFHGIVLQPRAKTAATTTKNQASLWLVFWRLQKRVAEESVLGSSSGHADGEKGE